MNWPVTRLGWIAETIVPQRDKPEDLIGPIPWLRIEDFSGKYLSTSKSGQGVTREQVASMPLRIFPKGTVICSCSCTMGATAIAAADLITNQTFIGLVPDTSKISPDFMYYQMQALAEHLQTQASGAIQQYLSKDEFRNLRFKLPPLPEQRRIADFLDDQVARIDNIIAARQQQISLASALGGAELAAIVFGSAERTIPLGYIALVDHGRQRSPDNDHGPYMTPYVRSANVGDGRIDAEDLLEMNFTPSERSMYGLRTGDVLVTEASGSVDAIGASAQWNEVSDRIVCYQNHLLRVRPRGGLADPNFLHWWARASYRSGAMRIWATGANILNLGSEALKKMPAPRLNLSQQRAVAIQAAETTASHEHADAALREQVARFTELKRSLITAAVSGEFDVSSADGSQVPVDALGGVPAGTSAAAGVSS